MENFFCAVTFLIKYTVTEFWLKFLSLSKPRKTKKVRKTIGEFENMQNDNTKMYEAVKRSKPYNLPKSC